MIIYGWMGRGTLLGTKNDLCQTCHVAGPHAIVRVVRWVTIFWAPVAPIWVSHKLICGNCRAETKLGWRQTRAALRSGRMPLHHRANFEAFAQKAYDDNYRRPLESEFDPVTRNPNRDAWNVYLKLWPVIVAVLIVAVVLWPRSTPVPASGGPAASHNVVEHACWIDSGGLIAGCRLADGSVLGVARGSPTTCYFQEPFPTGDVNIRCK
jgi:hypothetical protein